MIKAGLFKMQNWTRRKSDWFLFKSVIAADSLKNMIFPPTCMPCKNGWLQSGINRRFYNSRHCVPIFFFLKVRSCQNYLPRVHLPTGTSPVPALHGESQRTSTITRRVMAAGHGDRAVPLPDVCFTRWLLTDLMHCQSIGNKQPLKPERKQ